MGCLLLLRHSHVTLPLPQSFHGNRPRPTRHSWTAPAVTVALQRRVVVHIIPLHAVAAGTVGSYGQ